MNSEFHPHPRAALFRAVALRLWPVLLIGALLGAAGGWAAGMTVQDNRTATATVLLNPLEGNAFYPSARGEQLVNLATEAQVLSSNEVAKSVIDRTGADVTPQEMLEGVSTSVPANTQIVEVTYEHPDSETATVRAQTFAEAFLDFRRQRAVSYVDNQVKRIQTEIDNLTEQVRGLTSDLNAADTGIVDQNLIVAQIDSNSSQVAQLGAQKSALSTTPLEPGQIITPADVQRPGLLGTREILVAVGLICGLAAALAVFFYLSRGRGRIRSTAEVQAYNVEAVAAVPMPGAAEPSLAHPPGLNKVSSSYLQFRAQFLSLVRENHSETLLITSSSPKAALPVSVVPLALSLAAAEIRTVVVDTTGQIELPGAGAVNQPGLSELLLDGLPAEKALVRITPHLEAIGAGGLQDSSGDFLLNPRLTELLAELAGRADVVLVAGRSILTTGTQSLAASVQSVLVEVELGRTRHEDLHRTVEICAGLSVNLLGALVLDRSQEPADSGAGPFHPSGKPQPEESRREESPAYGA